MLFIAAAWCVCVCVRERERELLLSTLFPLQGLRPYSTYEATGLHLLNTLSKSHYSDSDIYWAHAALSKEAKVNVLISLQ